MPCKVIQLVNSPKMLKPLRLDWWVFVWLHAWGNMARVHITGVCV